jgi:hypothetical protein
VYDGTNLTALFLVEKHTQVHNSEGKSLMVEVDSNAEGEEEPLHQVERGGIERDRGFHSVEQYRSCCFPPSTVLLSSTVECCGLMSVV